MLMCLCVKYKIVMHKIKNRYNGGVGNLHKYIIFYKSPTPPYNK
jgi:hypothetical protein